MDRGCSKHVIGYLSKFIRLKRDQKRKVTFGDNLSFKIIGKEIVALSNKVKAKNVLLVENLKPNLLSVTQTCDEGHICIFDSKMCELERKIQENLLGLL